MTNEQIIQKAAERLYALWPEDYYDKYRNAPIMRTYEIIVRNAIDADRREQARLMSTSQKEPHDDQ